MGHAYSDVWRRMMQRRKEDSRIDNPSSFAHDRALCLGPASRHVWRAQRGGGHEARRFVCHASGRSTGSPPDQCSTSHGCALHCGPVQHVRAHSSVPGLLFVHFSSFIFFSYFSFPHPPIPLIYFLYRTFRSFK